ICGNKECTDNAKCVRNRCVCKDGFYGIGHIKCSDTCGGYECVKFSMCRQNKCKCNRGFYGDATSECKRLCGRQKKKCDEHATCKRNKCVCDKGYIGNGLKCHKPCTCSASGHIHYRTFDGSMIYHPGNCSYLLSDHTNSEDPSNNYRIIVHNEVGLKGEPVMIKSVLFEIYDQTVLLKGNEILVDELHTDLPFTSKTGALRIYRSGVYTLVETDSYVSIQWSGKATVLVETPSTYSPGLSGLCGDCNGQQDDYRTRERQDVSQSADRDTEIGNSYVTPALLDGKPRVCTVATPKQCKVGPKKIVGRPGKCGQLRPDVKRSKFLKCIKADPLLAKDMYNVCVQDYCDIFGNRKVREQVLCTVLEGYAARCSKMNTLARWRSRACKVGLNCPKQSVYRAMSRGCANSCANKRAVRDCTRPKVDGCMCKGGFFESGNTCVRKADCGCEDKGRYYKLGSIRRTSDCTAVEKCVKSKRTARFEIIASDEGCNEWATCKVVDGFYNCACEPGFIGDGYTCTPETSCNVTEHTEDCVATVKLNGRCIFKSKYHNSCNFFVYTLKNQSYIHFVGKPGHVTLREGNETHKDCASFSLDHLTSTLTIKETVCDCPGHDVS
ncbi:zonadhesin-like, partial [Mizuhopecten yessoensis]|uniref:zonadhesin-like n=1 Tax=Mizuhopecten yessoensis TaxID=6573 RepID=UPI000B45B076